MLASGTASLVRSRSGKHRTLYQNADNNRPLSGTAKKAAVGSYIGAAKYTYLEPIQNQAPIHMLKRATDDGRFVRWPNR
jgi:hypothetical protein